MEPRWSLAYLCVIGCPPAMLLSMLLLEGTWGFFGVVVTALALAMSGGAILARTMQARDELRGQADQERGR
jgi:hypothetical protein